MAVVEGLLEGHRCFGQVGRCRPELGLEVLNRFLEALVVLAQLLYFCFLLGYFALQLQIVGFESLCDSTLDEGVNVG